MMSGGLNREKKLKEGGKPGFRKFSTSAAEISNP